MRPGVIVDVSKLIECKRECIICYVSYHPAWKPDSPTEARLDWILDKTGIPTKSCKDHEVELAAVLLRRPNL